MDDNQQATYDAVMRALTDYAQQKEPRQNVLDIFSGTIPDGGRLFVPTSGEQVTFIFTSNSTTTVDVVLGRVDKRPAGEDIGGVTLFRHFSQSIRTGYAVTATLPIRSEHLTIFSTGGATNFTIIFHTSNMGVRT